MRTINTVLLMLALLCGTGACAMCGKPAAMGQEATINLENANVQAMNHVSVTRGGVHVHLTQGPQLNVKVDNPYGLGITITANGNTLDVEGVDGTIKKEQVAHVYVTLPNISDLAVMGAGDITAGNITTEQMDITVTGSGDIATGKLQVASLLKVKVTGSGDADITRAKANEVQIQVTGSGDVDIDDLNAKLLTAHIAGSGDMEIENGTVTDAQLQVKGSGDISARLTASGTVDVTQHGSGDITLRGNIAHLNKTSSGSGRVTYSPTR